MAAALAAHVAELNRRSKEALNFDPVTELTSYERSRREVPPQTMPQHPRVIAQRPSMESPPTIRSPLTVPAFPAALPPAAAPAPPTIPAPPTAAAPPTILASSRRPPPVAAAEKPRPAAAVTCARPGSIAPATHSTASKITLPRASTSAAEPPAIAVGAVQIGGAARWVDEDGAVRTSGVVTRMTPFVAELTSDEEAAAAAFARAAPPPPGHAPPPRPTSPPVDVSDATPYGMAHAETIGETTRQELAMTSHRFVRDLLASVHPPSPRRHEASLSDSALDAIAGTSTERLSSLRPLAETSISMSLADISHTLISSCPAAGESNARAKLAPWALDALDKAWFGPPDWAASRACQPVARHTDRAVDLSRRRRGSLVDGVPAALCVICFDCPCACADQI